MKLTAREKFLAKVCPESVVGCWLWQGLVRPDGYGAARFGGKEVGAHRVAWMLFRGEIEPGMAVCHQCDVRACVNPEHLFLGTAADNAQDMSDKGRSPRGESHGSAKLTAEQVRKIKVMLVENKLYMSEIAREFGVSQTTIRAIRTGRTWRDTRADSKPAVCAQIREKGERTG